MSNYFDENIVSLEEICRETRQVTDQETGQVTMKPAYFASMSAMLEGAFQFVTFFEKLHERGRVYGCNRADLFSFHLETGEMTFAGKDYLTEEGTGSDMEKAVVISEFLAPEILELGIDSDTVYTRETDLYFMSVFLFEYFFHTGTPFEGKKMVNRCFLSPLEKEMYRAQEGVFCMDAADSSNEPVKGIQDKLIRYWEEYPEILRKIFRKAFMNGGNLVHLRPLELEWKNVLVSLAMDYQICSCGFHGYSFRLNQNEDGTFCCPKCGRIYYPLSNGMSTILLAEGTELHECQTGHNTYDKDTVTGVVVENKQHKGLYGLKNVSDGIWMGLFPDGNRREILKGQTIPIWNNIQVSFEVGEDWSLAISSMTQDNRIEVEEENHEQ